jgi:sigma-E factor negative regulatory protein RseC
MILEKGRIVAVESDSLWVETIQRSTCNSCSAEPGCGQSLMAKLSGHSSYLRVLLEGRDAAHYHLGDEIQIGVPEDVVATGSLLVYLTPLFTMLLGSGLAHQLFANEGGTILAAFLGLCAGGLLVRWQAYRTRNDRRLQPVLVDEQEVVRVFS